MENGPCIDGLCLGGLVCSANTCVAPVDDDDDGDPTTGPATGSSTSTSTTSGEPSTAGESGIDTSSSSGDPTTGGVITTFESSTSDGESSTGSDPSNPGSNFIVDPDVGGGPLECSTWDQDCPAGEKCNAYADDGGNSWNATDCFDVDNSPDDVGEACTVEGSGVSGVDSCIAGAICWGVDPETNVGDCVAYCTGSEAAPECAAGTECVITNGGVLALCLPTCDPLEQDCAVDQGCYPVGELFVCTPDASGEMGYLDDPCEYVNACDPGLACIDGDALPDCNATGCCAPFCDLDVPDCPVDTECVGAFEEGQEPPGLADVGYCILPL